MEQGICDRIAESLRQGNSVSGPDRDHALHCEVCLDRVLNTCLVKPPIVTVPDQFAEATARHLLSKSGNIRIRRLRMLVFALPAAVASAAWFFFWHGMFHATVPVPQPGSALTIFSVAASVELTAIILWVSRATRV
jgi:hypothetical protein